MNHVENENTNNNNNNGTLHCNLFLGRFHKPKYVMYTKQIESTKP